MKSQFLMSCNRKQCGNVGLKYGKVNQKKMIMYLINVRVKKMPNPNV